MAHRQSVSGWARSSTERRRLGAILCAGLVLAMPAAVGAQSRTTGGVPRTPSVIVDYSVLEELGPEPTVPQILLPTLPRHSPPTARRPAARQPRLAPPPRPGRIVLKPPPRRPPSRTTRSQRRLPSRPATVKRRAAPRATAPPSRLAARPPATVTPPPIARPAPRPAARSAPRPPVSARLAPPARPVKPARPAVRARPSVPAAPKVVARPAPPPTRAAVPRPPVIAPVRSPPARPAATAKPAPEKTQSAALTSATGPFGAGRSYRLTFAGGEAKIQGSAARGLEEIARGMAKKPALRLELKAYAGGATTSASQSRRLSLSRALAVRSFLIDKGVRSTRINVRALGNKFGSGPADRVDVIVSRR